MGGPIHWTAPDRPHRHHRPGVGLARRRHGRGHRGHRARRAGRQGVWGRDPARRRVGARSWRPPSATSVALGLRRRRGGRRQGLAGARRFAAPPVSSSRPREASWTSLTVETGFLDGWVRVPGTTMHGSLPEEADNAVEKAARLLLALHQRLSRRPRPHRRPQHGHGAADRQLIGDERDPRRGEHVHEVAACSATLVDETRKEIEAICRRFGATFELHDQGGWW